LKFHWKLEVAICRRLLQFVTVQSNSSTPQASNLIQTSPILPQQADIPASQSTATKLFSLKSNFALKKPSSTSNLDCIQSKGVNIFVVFFFRSEKEK
jgi:hypothetical protein